jgi:beta-lactam-binding protein with PASTA domain
MYNFLRYSLLAFILLTVAFFSALAAMRMAIHGREVEVPKLVGLSPEEAEQQALDSGLLVEVENRFYSSSIPQGHILSQLPNPGVRVRRGWRVHLTESLGPQTVIVPNVVGQSLRFAEVNLRRRGLEPGDIALLNMPGRPPDQVIAQTPAAGAVGIAKPKVGLLATPPPTDTEYIMPSVVGLPIAEAVRQLEKAGIAVRQEPQVSAPPQLIPASSVQPASATPAMTVREAQPESKVANAASSATSSTVPARIVVLQRPPSGAKITSESTVELQVR